VVGVTAGEALWPVLIAEAAVRRCEAVLCLSVARRGRIFVEENGAVRAVSVPDFHLPAGLVLLAGNAAADFAGGAALLSDHCVPDGVMIARAALARHEGTLPPRATLPLYVDPPEAKLPAAGLRPAPR
jgi:hypothetical protein